MDQLFTYLQTHRSGILFLILILAILVFLAQWVAWIFGLGRFGKLPAPTARAPVRFIISDAAVKIINDFRHLLALIVVVIFALALGYALIKAASVTSESPTMLNNMKEALQAVVATLGGLVGSIIGYYFGESSVAKPSDAKPTETPGSQPAPAVQEPPKPGGQQGAAPPKTGGQQESASPKPAPPPPAPPSP